MQKELVKSFLGQDFLDRTINQAGKLEGPNKHKRTGLREMVRQQLFTGNCGLSQTEAQTAYRDIVRESTREQA